MSAVIRTLRSGEEETLLELLDGWELPDGWRGRDFFRRYVEDDPTFQPENVWVAEQGASLQACVQIFPRRLYAEGHALPAGGIGSVFTRPEARGEGLASALLERATGAMRERGLEVALLFTDRIGFYAARGWSEWPLRARWIERRTEGVELRSGSIVDFEGERDLDAVRSLHAAYSERTIGVALRDVAAWRGSLRIAGNPAEDFRVAREGDALRAYVRAVVLEGVLVISEVGFEADAVERLVDLVADLLEPRTPDPLAAARGDSSALRVRAVLPPIEDPDLDAALAARGLIAKSVPWNGVMLRCVDAEALARRLDAPAPRSAEEQTSLLRRCLPPERFTFWPADRF